MVFPITDEKLAMEYVQTDEGRVQQVKVVTAHSPEELERLQKIGWKVQE
jgi:hypothetical protein